MFNAEKIEKLEKQIRDLEHSHSLEIENLKFEMDHLERKKLKERQEEIIELTKTVAVLEKKIEMLDKIVDLNADLVDVKSLINALIDKLPEFKINKLALMAGNTNDDE